MRAVFPIEALDRWLQHRMLEVHTALPAKVTAYDAAAQTVDVRPQIKRYVLDSDGARTAEALPDLYGVPVAFPRAGGFHQSFPIAVDDYVLIICSEEPTQAWRTKAREVAPGFLDRHGLNGAFAVPCGFPDAEKLATAPPVDAVEIASNDGAAAILVKASEVLLGDASATEAIPRDDHLQTELNRLKTELDAVKTDLSTLKSAISGAAVVAMDGGAAFKTAIVAALAAWPAMAPASPGATATDKVKGT